MKSNNENNWFRIDKVFGLPKPICWQGWVWYILNVLIIFAAVQFMMVYTKDLASFSLCIIGGSTIIFIMIAFLKSNFLELIESMNEI